MVVPLFFEVVVVDDHVVVDPLSEPLEPNWGDFDLDFESTGGSVLVVVA